MLWTCSTCDRGINRGKLLSYFLGKGAFAKFIAIFARMRPRCMVMQDARQPRSLPHNQRLFLRGMHVGIPIHARPGSLI